MSDCMTKRKKELGVVPVNLDLTHKNENVLDIVRHIKDVHRSLFSGRWQPCIKLFCHFF